MIRYSGDESVPNHVTRTTCTRTCVLSHQYKVDARIVTALLWAVGLGGTAYCHLILYEFDMIMLDFPPNFPIFRFMIMTWEQHQITAACVLVSSYQVLPGMVLSKRRCY